jgi:hypothetical protein
MAFFVVLTVYGHRSSVPQPIPKIYPQHCMGPAVLAGAKASDAIEYLPFREVLDPDGGPVLGPELAGPDDVAHVLAGTGARAVSAFRSTSSVVRALREYGIDHDEREFSSHETAARTALLTWQSSDGSARRQGGS